MARYSLICLLCLATALVLLSQSMSVQAAVSPLQPRRGNGSGMNTPAPKDGPFYVQFKNITDPNSNQGQATTIVQGQLKDYGVIEGDNAFNYNGTAGFGGGFNVGTSDPASPGTAVSGLGGGYHFNKTDVTVGAGINAFGAKVNFQLDIDSKSNVMIHVDIPGRIGDLLTCERSKGQDNSKGTLTCTTVSK